MAPLPSWLPIPADSDFSLANIPFGIISSRGAPQKRPAVAIGDHVLDLAAFAAGHGFAGAPFEPHLAVFAQPTLNAFAALGRPVHAQVRAFLQDVFAAGGRRAGVLRDDDALRAAALLPREHTTTHLPMRIGDYTDFFAGVNHAVNVGTLFRGAANALQPNYTHLPVGYHGRASSVVVSGTPITRPNGQMLLDPAAEPKQPVFGPSRRLDVELELGCLLCRGSALGKPIRLAAAEAHIFGYVLLNDWSARDLQTWEYVPLGPFNAKNFGTTVSAWVVLADALAPFRVPKLPNATRVLPHLAEADAEPSVFDIQLELALTTPAGATTTLARVSSRNLLWSFPQMLAHHASGGCPMAVGDLLGSGTISGTRDDRSDRGSMLEMTDGGKREIRLAGTDTRTFLEDGDAVVMRGWCGAAGERVGFGRCEGTVQSAPNL